MSMFRPIAWLAAVIVALGMAGGAWAQVPTSPGSSHLWQFQPFADPSQFSPDFQFFAPAEVDDFGGEEKPHTGIYVTFDRTYVNVSRPINQFSFGSGNQGDFTWGNRMEIGYMLGDPSGWQAVLWHVNGPNETFSNADFLERFQGTSGGNTVTQEFPQPGAIDSLNQLKMSSFEFNKTWRLKPHHNGAILEPLLGYRYMNVRDYFRRERLTEITGDTGVPSFPQADEFLLNNSHITQFENQMHGGQFGARLFRQRGHWLLSADLRFFAMANFQTLKIVNQQSILANPDLSLVDGVTEDKINFFGTGGDINRQLAYHRATQFAFGGEVRGEAS